MCHMFVPLRTQDMKLLNSVTNKHHLALLKNEAEKIIASKPFNRLKGLYQFSINYTDPQLTNRQKHSFYVAEVGRTICDALELPEASGQLAYNIGLIHDIGHPPFSHWGEASIKEHLGENEFLWNHDTAGLNCVTVWSPEIGTSNFTLEGLAKRYWRYDLYAPISATNHSISELPLHLQNSDELHLAGLNHLEGQIAAQADRIAFNATDIQDGLMTGVLTPYMLRDFFPSAYAVYETLLNQYVKEYKKEQNSNLDEEDIRDIILNTQAIHAIVFSRFSEAFKNYQMNDLISTTKKLIQQRNISSVSEIRAQRTLTADFSDELKQDFYSFAKFCKETIFAKRTKPFKSFVDSIVQYFIKNPSELHGSYRVRFEETHTHIDKILIIAEYMTREMTDQDVIIEVLRHDPDVYFKYFPGYESIKQEKASVMDAQTYLNSIVKPQKYPSGMTHPINYISLQTKHILALPVEAKVICLGTETNEINAVIALAKRYKITDKKLVILIIDPLISKEKNLQKEEYQSLIKEIEKKMLPIEIRYVPHNNFSCKEHSEGLTVTLVDFMALDGDYLIDKEIKPEQKAVMILTAIHKKKNAEGPIYNRPSPQEESEFAKQYISTNSTSDPRFPNTNNVLPTWVRYGEGATPSGERIYTTERLALHDVIIQAALSWNPVTKTHTKKSADLKNSPTFHLICGGMSVGMTYMQRLMIHENVIDPNHSVIITPLTYMPMPEFIARFHYQHPEKSLLLVEEYYDITKKIVHKAMEQGLNVVFVDQADDREAIIDILNHTKKQNYASSIVGLTMSPEAYYAASQLWLTKFNRIPDHSRGFGDLREFSENWPYYKNIFDAATLIETYFHVNDIDKNEDDVTRKEYEVEVIFSAHYNKAGHRIEKIQCPERYTLFLDRAIYIKPGACTLDEANKDYPYPQNLRQLDSARGTHASIKLNSPIKHSENSSVSLTLKNIRGFFKDELELKFKEMVRKTTEQRTLIRKAKLDATKIQLILEVINGTKDSMDFKNRLIPFEETQEKVLRSLKIDKISDPVQQQGTLIVLAGGPCSGKSTYLERIGKTFEMTKNQMIVISGSEIKKMIPEYELLASLWKKDNSNRILALDNKISEEGLFYIGENLYNLFDKEKEALILTVIDQLTKMGVTVLLEDHLADKEFATALFQTARNNKAYTVLIAPDVSIENFFMRGRIRQANTGKWLMPIYALAHHKKFEKNWPYYLSLTDIACRIDNNGTPNSDSLSAIAIYNRLYVLQEQKYMNAVAKAHLEITRTTHNDDVSFCANDVYVPDFQNSINEPIKEEMYPEEKLVQLFPDSIIELINNLTSTPCKEKDNLSVSIHF